MVRKRAKKYLKGSIEHKIYILFRKSGFAIEEAEWAADNMLTLDGPRGKQVERLLRNRKANIEALIKYARFTREEAIEDRYRARLQTATEAGFMGDDLENVFVGESPW